MVIFFLFGPIFIFGPCRYWRNFGPKICGERSVCPMVTKLSGFGLYLHINLMKVENLNFGHGVVLFLVLETFLVPKIRTSLTFRQFYTNIWNLAHYFGLLMSPSWHVHIFTSGKFSTFLVLDQFIGPKCFGQVFFETLHTSVFVMCSSFLCKKKLCFWTLFETTCLFWNFVHHTTVLMYHLGLVIIVWSWARCDEHVTIVKIE